MIIPFSGPSIQAHTPEEQTAFTSLKQIESQASSSIGYFIRLGKRYRETGVFEVDAHEQALGTLLPNCGG